MTPQWRTLTLTDTTDDRIRLTTSPWRADRRIHSRSRQWIRLYTATVPFDYHGGYHRADETNIGTAAEGYDRQN